MGILKTIKQEITNYEGGTAPICDGYSFSGYKLNKRITMFKNCVYPTGKIDSQGNYKYYFDIISPRADSEIKNLDFDTSNIILVSDSKADAGRILIANSRLGEFLNETGQASKLNEAVERGTEWGDVVAKKVKGDYRLMDLNNFYVLNQIAETLEDSDTIEKEIMYSSDLRKRIGVWDNVEELLKTGKKTGDNSSPEFYIYERNGEINQKEYNESIGKEGGDENKYILAKIIVGGIKKDEPTQILFSMEITEKPYIEYHRGKFSGRWRRVGMYELLFDLQTRANEIGNQIARGLEWSSKTIFKSSDRVLAQNILTDLQNGDVVKSIDLSQVDVRMHSLDQLIADWNRIMEMADRLANSYEIVTGGNLPSGTPFALGNLQNINANKLFDFIREKLTITFTDIVSKWILPDILKDLKALDIVKLTNDPEKLQLYYKMIVDEWYINNLIALPPHSPEMAITIKEEKIKELSINKDVIVKLSKKMWANFKPRVKVVITGENFDLIDDLETLKSFITLEQDPVRRTALIEMAMRKKNIDIEALPKTEVQQEPQQPQQQPVQAQQV